MKQLAFALAAIATAIGVGVTIAVTYVLYMRYRTTASDFWLICGAVSGSIAVTAHFVNFNLLARLVKLATRR